MVFAEPIYTLNAVCICNFVLLKVKKCERRLKGKIINMLLPECYVAQKSHFIIQDERNYTHVIYNIR